MKDLRSVFSGLCIVSAVCSADVVVDDFATVDLAVSNVVVQSSALYFSADAAKLEKSGAGTWTVAASNVPSIFAKAKFSVREGGLNLVGGTPAEVPVPTAALNKAAMCFRATT